MKRLHLLRHAKSSWADPGQRDRERPLAPRGRRAARRLGSRLRDLGVRPDLVLCSPAKRAVQTLELIRPGLDSRVQVVIEEALYGAGAPELLERVRRLPESVGSALVVGHNPELQEVVVLLAAAGAARERARYRFPTAALATLVLRRGGWSDLGPERADLVSYVVPRELE